MICKDDVPVDIGETRETRLDVIFDEVPVTELQRKRTMAGRRRRRKQTKH